MNRSSCNSSRYYITVEEAFWKSRKSIDDIIKLIRTSKDSGKPKEVLMSDSYGLSNEQASAILDLRLGRLTSLEEGKLRDEHVQLTSDISHLSLVMSDDALVNDIMRRETIELKVKHAVPRKSVLWGEEAGKGISKQTNLAKNKNNLIIIHSFVRSGLISLCLAQHCRRRTCLRTRDPL